MLRVCCPPFISDNTILQQWAQEAPSHIYGRRRAKVDKTSAIYIYIFVPSWLQKGKPSSIAPKPLGGATHRHTLRSNKPK